MCSCLFAIWKFHILFVYILECSRTCIVALTACSLEMKKTMHSMIGEVLLRLSKIALTKHVAAPMLEFLSTLIRVPEIFRSFIDDQYLTVFAIALRFTNPFKFDSYTVRFVFIYYYRVSHMDKVDLKGLLWLCFWW